VALIDIKAPLPRVLLAQRPQGKANEGLWEFPGGKVCQNTNVNLSSYILRNMDQYVNMQNHIADNTGNQVLKQAD